MIGFLCWPKLEMEVRLRKPSVIHQSPGHFGLIATDAVVDFLGWLLQVVGQSSIFMYDLIIIHLYIQSLRTQPSSREGASHVKRT